MLVRRLRDSSGSSATFERNSASSPGERLVVVGRAVEGFAVDHSFAKIYPLGRDAFIAMVKPSKFWNLDHAAVTHNRALDGTLLSQSKMRMANGGNTGSKLPGTDPDGLMGDAVGKAVPPSIKVANPKNKAKRIFLEGLRLLCVGPTDAVP